MTKQWTNKEIEKMREWYPYLNRAGLVKMFPGRSVNALVTMARNIGLHKEFVRDQKTVAAA